MMPTTVPNSPTNGLTEAMVASQVMRRSRAVTASLAAVCAERSSGDEVARRTGSAGLPLVGFVHVFIDLRQRAGLAVRGELGNLLQARGLAEGADKAAALFGGLAEGWTFCPG
jgi:hypothetical protein